MDDPEREFEMKVVLSAFASAALSMTCFSKAVYNKEVWRARDNGAKFDVMLSVIDDEGTPVANARCGGWMCMEHDSKHGRGYAVFTDTNGCVRVTGECSEWLSITIAQTELNKVLGDGIPATSFAAGANETGGVADNYNYQGAGNTPNGWPRLDDDDNPLWEHSDLKNVAYFYVRQLFKKIVDETKQRR